MRNQILGRRVSRRRVLAAAPAAGAVLLVPRGRAEAAVESGGPRWSAMATFVSASQARRDPAGWSRGDAALQAAAWMTIDDIVLPTRAGDRPERIDVAVMCGEEGEHPFHAWCWRRDDPFAGSRPLSFVAPVHDHGLCIELAVDGEAPLVLSLHAGTAPGEAKLREGAYEIELHRMDSDAEATRLRIAFARQPE